MKIQVVKDPVHVAEVRSKLKETQGYCPCVPSYAWNEDTKCICKEFREQKEEGFCHCERYKKVKKEEA